jgi:hypothetical protein
MLLLSTMGNILFCLLYDFVPYYFSSYAIHTTVNSTTRVPSPSPYFKIVILFIF